MSIRSIVIAKSEKEAKSLLNALIEFDNFRWVSGGMLNPNDTSWILYGENTCYNIRDNQVSIINLDRVLKNRMYGVEEYSDYDNVLISTVDFVSTLDFEQKNLESVSTLDIDNFLATN